jgi:drug/metabolite transporter (DMT)-like permease
VTRREGLRVDAALFAMTFFWAANIVVLKLLLGHLSPILLSALRFVIVTLTAFLVLLVRGGPWRVERRDIPRLVVSSILGISLYQILFMNGLDRTAAFTSNLIQGTEPLFVLILLSMTRTRVLPRQWAGILVALCGAVVFFLEDPRGGRGLAFGWGEALNLLSALSFAAYGLVSAPLFARYPGRTVMAYSMALGALPLVALGASSFGGVRWGTFSGAVWTGLFYSSLFPVYVGFWVWNWAILRKGLAHASLYLFLDIVVSGLFAHVVLGERFGLLRLTGAAIILAGIGLARSDSEPPRTGESIPHEALPRERPAEP